MVQRKVVGAPLTRLETFEPSRGSYLYIPAATLPRQYYESTVPISKYILTSPLSSQEKHEYHHRAVGQTASPGVMDVRNIL